MLAPILICGVIGFLLGRWLGLVVGVALGYGIGAFLRGLATATRRMAEIQSRFLDSTFAVMGAVCKADGRVTGDEIRVAEQVFDRLHLSAEQRSTAKRAFRRGRDADFDLDAEVAAFARVCRHQRTLAQVFLQVQLAAVAADGQVDAGEHAMLVRIARGLGLAEAEVEQLEALLRGSAAGAGAGPSLEDAYRVLGVDASASDAEIKKAYRRLMSQNHPDKLAGRGLPEGVREMAEEKTREIGNAYRRIKEARGLT